jgi:AI-2 transport protein TqsA
VIAVTVAFLLVVALLGLLGVLLIFAVQTIVRTAVEYSEKVGEMAEHLFAEFNQHRVQIDQARISNELEARLPGIITQAAGTATSVLTDSFLIAVFVIFLLLGRDSRAVRPRIYREIEGTIRSYITTKAAISAVTGILVWLILWGFGLRMAPLFGLLAFLFNFIPSIGSIIATLLPIPIAFAQFENQPWMILAVVGLPGTVHMTIGNVIEPRLMGRGLELHPVTVLLALAFWGLLWGIVGMVLAVPIVAAMRIVFSHFSSTRPLAEMLAGRLPGATSAAVYE